jgi:hypothetical protein
MMAFQSVLALKTEHQICVYRLLRAHLKASGALVPRPARPAVPSSPPPTSTSSSIPLSVTSMYPLHNQRFDRPVHLSRQRLFVIVLVCSTDEPCRPIIVHIIINHHRLQQRNVVHLPAILLPALVVYHLQ